jgi:non-lysosomal glucosylceramidase
MERRKFLRNTGFLATGIYYNPLKVIAGPFEPSPLLHNIPVDKKLDPQWVKSLYHRGFATAYKKSKNELQYIGMPVGGIFTGTVYLGGDGRLWLWDIFNENQNGIDPKTIDWNYEQQNVRKVQSKDGAAYIQPAADIRPLEQGFAFTIETAGKRIVKKMQAGDWDEIVFEATYPIAKIHYIDNKLDIEITAEVFSPFIPLDENNSGLPSTVYSFSFRNKTKYNIEISITGWLENKVSLKSAKATDTRINSCRKLNGATIVSSSIKNDGNPAQSQQPDYGTLAIAAWNGQDWANTNFALPFDTREFDARKEDNTEKKVSEGPLLNAVTTKMLIRQGQQQKAVFALAWHFSNLTLQPAIRDKGRFYNNRFKNAEDVLIYVHSNFKKLKEESFLWKDTWYDSTLPWWFLERTFLNISTLATTTAHRFESGRFYAWEGVGCCAGTCTHVWQYAQAMGRIFPAIERDTRERIDLGMSLMPDGMIWFRGEMAKSPAIDGQAGTILRILREHQMSTNDDFLRRNWDHIKLAVTWVIKQDRNKDGMEDTPLENTLDAKWDGEIAWLVGLCIAAVKAGQVMAEEMGDNAFAAVCADYISKGTKNMEEQLFNGEYFIHKPDEIKGREKLGSYNTCHIDQVFGQSWAYQVGLGRVIDKSKTLSALRSLWKYNFTPDVGPYIKERKGWRPYALAGEGGMVMNTNPANEEKPYGENVTWQLGYFHECMSGFEHQVASHMMAEGMVEESLVLTRMIHDRYHAFKRNPFNEIECSDHYSRAMASYGTFITACGFTYNGPKGHIGFAPKLKPENCKLPFTAANAWGSYRQTSAKDVFTASLEVKYGTLQLNTFSFEAFIKGSTVSTVIDGEIIQSTLTRHENNFLIRFHQPVTIQKGHQLSIKVV